MAVQDDIAEVTAKEVITIEELKAVLESLKLYADLVDAALAALDARVDALET